MTTSLRVFNHVLTNEAEAHLKTLRVLAEGSFHLHTGRTFDPDVVSNVMKRWSTMPQRTDPVPCLVDGTG